MDLKDYYRLILRNLKVVLVSTLVGIFAAAGITFSQTPIYQADVQLFVSTPSSALDIGALAQGSSFSQQRVISYAQIINGPATLNPVISALHLSYTETELAKHVKATAPLNTVLIDVTVSDPDSQLAADIANAIGNQFSATASSLESSSGNSTVKVSMVKNAIRPPHPSSPKKTLNLLLGIILGFGLGIALAIVRQIFDNTIKNDLDLEELPLLAAIGFDEDAETKPLVTDLGRYAVRAEAFRSLRTNIQFLKTDKKIQIITLSSSLPGEGKTTTSVNLAISMAQSGLKVLYIEGDLRRPRSSKYLKIAGGTSGFTDVLAGRISPINQKNVSDLIVDWGNDGLKFLPSGNIPPNPAELLNSEYLDQFFILLRTMFDYVIIDSPPLLPVTDAAILAKKSDGVILVAKAGKTRVGQFRGSKDSLNAVGATILGGILNMIPLAARDYDNYGYRYGYAYGYRRKYGGYYSGKYGKSYGKEYGKQYGREYGESEHLPQAIIEAQLAPYSPLPDELVRLEIESLAGDLEKEFSPRAAGSPRSPRKPAAKKAATKKVAPSKSTKRVVNKVGSSTKRAPRKSSR